ncbi:hypothetical protein LCGC14_0432540 [marine sediment metagenome]|uniref:Uncharacterized protein n=1 Tax=marine sediment metagenome TaxID=412755 RepID=A0A0F9SMI2_9ZZZZ
MKTKKSKLQREIRKHGPALFEKYSNYFTPNSEQALSQIWVKNYNARKEAESNKSHTLKFFKK